MVAWKLKGCPRCRGDLLIEREYDGPYESCLMCGYRRDIPDPVYIDKSADSKDRQPSKKDKVTVSSRS